MLELKPQLVQLHCVLDEDAIGRVAASELNPMIASHSTAAAQLVAVMKVDSYDLDALLELFVELAEQRGMVIARSLLQHLKIESGDPFGDMGGAKKVTQLDPAQLATVARLYAAAGGSECVKVPVMRLQRAAVCTPSLANLSDLLEHSLSCDEAQQVQLAQLQFFFVTFARERGVAAMNSLMAHLERGLKLMIQSGEFSPPKDENAADTIETLESDDVQQILRLFAASCDGADSVDISVLEAAFGLETGQLMTPLQTLNALSDDGRASETDLIRFFSEMCLENGRAKTLVVIKQLEHGLQRHSEMERMHPTRDEQFVARSKPSSPQPPAAISTVKPAAPVVEWGEISPESPPEPASEPAIAQHRSNKFPEDLGVRVLQIFWALDTAGTGAVKKGKFEEIAPQVGITFANLKADISELVPVNEFVDFFNIMLEESGLEAVKELVTQLQAKCHWNEVYSAGNEQEEAPGKSRPHSRQSGIEPIQEDEVLISGPTQPREQAEEPHETVPAEHQSRPSSRADSQAADFPDDLGVVVLQIFWAMDEQGLGKVQKEAFEEIDSSGTVFKAIDTDENGYVDIEEFVSFFNVMMANDGAEAVRNMLDKLQAHFDWETRSQASSATSTRHGSSNNEDSRPGSSASRPVSAMSKPELESWHSWENRKTHEQHSWSRAGSGKPPRPESARIRPGSGAANSGAAVNRSIPIRPESARVRMEGANGRPARYSRPSSAYSRTGSRPASRFSRPDSATSRSSVGSSVLSSADFPNELGVRVLHIFWALDETSRGTVIKQEIEDLDESGVVFEDLDADDNGFVDIDEFVAFFNVKLADVGQEAVEKILSNMETHFELA